VVEKRGYDTCWGTRVWVTYDSFTHRAQYGVGMRVVRIDVQR
jgi:hypothetical protein